MIYKCIIIAVVAVPNDLRTITVPTIPTQLPKPINYIYSRMVSHYLLNSLLSLLLHLLLDFERSEILSATIFSIYKVFFKTFTWYLHTYLMDNTLNNLKHIFSTFPTDFLKS